MDDANGSIVKVTYSRPAGMLPRKSASSKPKLPLESFSAQALRPHRNLEQGQPELWCRLLACRAASGVKHDPEGVTALSAWIAGGPTKTTAGTLPGCFFAMNHLPVVSVETAVPLGTAVASGLLSQARPPANRWQASSLHEPQWC